MNIYSDRINRLREHMSRLGIDAYILPTNGPHMSEYPAEYWNCRSWLSGFTGSAGTLVVSAERAGLWTDGRYFLQAEDELDGSGIDLFRMGQDGVPSIKDWLSDELSEGQVAAACGLQWMQSDYDNYRQYLSNYKISFDRSEDLIELIWADRPSLSKKPVFIHPVTYAGQDTLDKLKDLREQCHHHGAKSCLITSLDEIGWILNLRGSDVDFNPVFYSYLVIGFHDEKISGTLYIDESKITSDVRDYLTKKHIRIAPYNYIFDEIDQVIGGGKCIVDPKVTNARLYSCLQEEKIITLDAPVKHLKAIKNETERKHLRHVMVKDGVALVRAFRWLEKELKSGVSVSEYDFGLQLDHFRSQQEGYFGPSFSSIVGYNAHGAIIHYRADEHACALIEPRGVLLVDSGGQYIDGTTDITRTINLGHVTGEQKKHYTLVLKGHIALATAHFPKGTRGIQLDTYARMYLWQDHLNYGHGTGHGVGFFMNVHEPPQGIAPVVNERGTTVHLPGMYTSNEPGYYLDGSYGIRLENLILCTPAVDNSTDDWLRFETITLYPFDLTFIDIELLTSDEIAWLNSYHRKVEKSLSPHLDEEERAWLAHQCRSIR